MQRVAKPNPRSPLLQLGQRCRLEVSVGTVRPAAPVGFRGPPAGSTRVLFSGFSTRRVHTAPSGTRLYGWWPTCAVGCTPRLFCLTVGVGSHHRFEKTPIDAGSRTALDRLHDHRGDTTAWVVRPQPCHAGTGPGQPSRPSATGVSPFLRRLTMSRDRRGRGGFAQKRIPLYIGLFM